MKAAESIQALYEIVEKIKGPHAAREFIVGEISILLSELQDEKISVTAEAIEERLSKVANDFITVTKNKNDVA